MWIELGVERFREICQLTKRMKAKHVLFLEGGIVHFMNAVQEEQQLHGDWVFLSGDITVKKAFIIEAVELQRIHQLLGLSNETERSVRNERIRIEPDSILTIPFSTTYRRRTRYELVDLKNARRFERMASYESPPDFRLLPRPQDAKGERRIGGPKVYLDLGQVALMTTRGETRVAGFSRVQHHITFLSPSARSLLAYAIRRAALAESIVSGTINGNHVHLWSDGFQARMHTSIHEKRKLQCLLKTK